MKTRIKKQIVERIGRDTWMVHSRRKCGHLTRSYWDHEPSDVEEIAIHAAHRATLCWLCICRNFSPEAAKAESQKFDAAYQAAMQEVTQ